MTAERLKILIANYISDDLEASETCYVLDKLYRCGFDDEEIKEIGYDWLFMDD